MTNIVVPELGESVLEARVARWLKKDGDRVEVGEPLVELETEKINLEVNAERGGVISGITRQEGEDVKIGEVLGDAGRVRSRFAREAVARARRGRRASARRRAAASAPRLRLRLRSARRGTGRRLRRRRRLRAKPAAGLPRRAARRSPPARTTGGRPRRSGSE